MKCLTARIVAILFLLPLLGSPWFTDGQVVPAAGLIVTEAALRAGLAGSGPLVIGSSIILSSPLPTISKYILIQGDAVRCRAQTSGWCSLSTQYRFRHFVVANGGHLVLLNLRLKAGRSGNSGGSILVASKSRLAVQSVFFQYNFAAGKLYGGGAVEVTGQSTFVAKKSLFLRNLASFGGAVDVADGSLAAISGCIFHNNSAGLAGGAISLLAGGWVKLVSNEFTRNSATIGGAIYADGSRVIVCDGVQFRNTATLQGPTLFAGSGTDVSLCNVSTDIVTVSSGGVASETCTLC